MIEKDKMVGNGNKNKENKPNQAIKLQKKQSALAADLHTIPYEILTSVSMRIPRLFFED